MLANARFAAAVLVNGVKNDEPVVIRWDVSFPTLYQIRQRGLIATPIAYATAHLAALFIKHFPKDMRGVMGAASMPAEARQAILAGARARDFKMTVKTTRLKQQEDDEEL